MGRCYLNPEYTRSEPVPISLGAGQAVAQGASTMQLRPWLLAAYRARSAALIRASAEVARVVAKLAMPTLRLAGTWGNC